MFKGSKNYKDIDCWLLAEEVEIKHFESVNNYNSIKDGLPQSTNNIKKFPDFDMLYSENIAPSYHRIPCKYYGAYRRLTSRTPIHFHVSRIYEILHGDIPEVLKLIQNSKQIYRTGDVWTDIIYKIENL